MWDFFHNSTFVKTKQADIQNFLYSLTFSTTFIFTPKFNGHVCYMNSDVFFLKTLFFHTKNCKKSQQMSKLTPGEPDLTFDDFS